mmetsp:Transcript_130547/g.226901  ORF Transcript_130547/g.226901 Transcript_130547/m.226901 type:complete len:143 (+) Transcript_130547:685-1113(+)
MRISGSTDLIQSSVSIGRSRMLWRLAKTCSSSESATMPNLHILLKPKGSTWITDLGQQDLAEKLMIHRTAVAKPNCMQSNRPGAGKTMIATLLHSSISGLITKYKITAPIERQAAPRQRASGTSSAGKRSAKARKLHMLLES